MPGYIKEAALSWIRAVELDGIKEVRKTPGYCDKPLKGIRRGQRSVRLNRAYRIIYTEENKQLTVINIMEISKHDY